MDAQSRLKDAVIQKMRRDIKEADGNEVFWSARVDEDGIVCEVHVGARGNEDSVVVNQDATRSGNVLIHNHPSGNLTPSEEDQAIAFNATDSSQGFYIVDNEVKCVYVVVEPVKPKKRILLDEDECTAFLEEGGPLSKVNPQYEKRESQIKLVKGIAGVFNSKKIGIFEAGTGVGKSFAYLIPSMLWAYHNKERVVFSTGTINLQQQLFEKDIPLAQKITGLDVKAVLLKGRQNYVCLRRLKEAAKEPELFSEDNDTLQKISEWAKTTSTGSVSDLSFVPPDSVWNRVNSESDACLASRCPFREDCFVMKLRREAGDANLIVVNHHLLFADIESRMSGVGYDDTAVLPPYKHIVFDEAHGIEDSATSFFSETINRFRLNKQLNLLYRTRHTSIAGFLVQAEAVVNGNDGFLEDAAEGINAIRENFANLEDIARGAMDTDNTSRLYAKSAKHFVSMLDAMEVLRTSISVFCARLRDVFENNIAEEDQSVPSVWEAKNAVRRLEDMAVLLGNFISWDEHEDQVFWMEKGRIAPKKAGDDFITFVKFVQTPLDVAPLMNSGVFEPMESVVCTSATLKIGDSFSYWMRRVGASFAPKERLSSDEFLSPFPYTTNVLFAVPNDAPFPKSEYFQNYIEETLPKFIQASRGRTLVLFTSYDSLRSAYKACALTLSQKGFPVMKQGDDDRFRLMERFKEDTESVLFATESFWEGVDVPGESLSQVIMVKLPFAVPSDPVFAARSELVEKRGESSFMELSVPQAVIKFRQGFGRLMRHSDDRGVVLVLDRRIVENPYGKLFTSSVPKTRRMYNSTQYIVTQIEKLFEQPQQSEESE